MISESNATDQLLQLNNSIELAKRDLQELTETGVEISNWNETGNAFNSYTPNKTQMRSTTTRHNTQRGARPKQIDVKEIRLDSSLLGGQAATLEPLSLRQTNLFYFQQHLQNSQNRKSHIVSSVGQNEANNNVKIFRPNPYQPYNEIIRQTFSMLKHKRQQRLGEKKQVSLSHLVIGNTKGSFSERQSTLEQTRTPVRSERTKKKRKIQSTQGRRTPKNDYNEIMISPMTIRQFEMKQSLESSQINLVQEMHEVEQKPQTKMLKVKIQQFSPPIQQRKDLSVIKLPNKVKARLLILQRIVEQANNVKINPLKLVDFEEFKIRNKLVSYRYKVHSEEYRQNSEYSRLKRRFEECLNMERDNLNSAQKDMEGRIAKIKREINRLKEQQDLSSITTQLEVRLKQVEGLQFKKKLLKQ